MIQLILGTLYTQLKPVPIRLATLLEDQLRYLSTKATEYNSEYTSGRWDGFIRLYDRPNGRFPTGLLIRVKRILEEQGLVKNRDFEIINSLPDMPPVTQRHYCPQWDLRPYQEEAVTSALKNRRGVLSIPTGGGKTEIAQEIIHQSGVSKILFLVPSRALLRQTVRRFQRAFPDSNVLQWGDGKGAPSDSYGEYILIATAQSAFKAKHKLVREAGAVFVDESHRQASDMFKTVTQQCVNSRYLIGLSATPFRSDGADMELEAWLGPIIYKVGYDHLIDNGWLVPPEFRKVRTIEEALQLTRGKKTLIFSEKWSDILQHASTFERHQVVMLNSKSKDVPGWLKKLEDGVVTHLVVTPMFDEGLDIPDIEAIINFATCGSRVKVIQRIGRVMRLHPGKEKCLIVDLIDHKYSDRMEAYLKEPAFAKRL